jgi:hypothetical protein
MQIGQIFRYAKDFAQGEEIVDGYPNFFFHTATSGCSRVTLARGINAVASAAADGPRLPVIVLSSSPHKIGSEQTPWQDFFNPDEGYVRYFGDAKDAGVNPAHAPGNAVMLIAKQQHDVMEPSLTGPRLVVRFEC